MSEINIVIPTYNEEENIKKLVLTIFKILPKCNIIIVDDSEHNKVALAIKSISKKKNLRYIHRKN